MSIQSIPVLMNGGLDLVSPPLLAEPGVLIDCLNYEMTAYTGYRRVDGYERYDGWVDGGVASYFVVNLLADVPADQDKITIGSLLGNLDALSSKPVYYGVVVAVNGLEVKYVPFRRTDTINNNQRVYLLNNLGITYFFTATSGSTSGKSLATDMEQFTQELRDYSTTLREMVMEDATAVAGINYSRDRLWKVLDSYSIQFLAANIASVTAGTIFSYNGKLWRVIAKEDRAPNRAELYYAPTGAGSTNDPALWIPVNADGTSGTAWPAPIGSPNTTESEYGYMVFANNPDIKMIRGNTPVTPSPTIRFDNGKWVDKDGPIAGVTTLYFTSGSSVISAKVANWVATDLDGSWTAGTKKPRMQLSNVTVVSGPAWVPGNAWEVHSALPATSGNKVGDVVGDAVWPILAGTMALRRQSTRYQWGTYNFYAREDMYETYGTNGVYRAFWVKPDSYANIYTQDNLALDNPKYLSMHARNSLVLGFADGSIMLSVGGEPYNYDGVLGAAEIATGDRITGLLESTSDSTLIFGKRSISRLVGTSTENYQSKTVVPNAGAYDYTAVNVGGQPVFTDPAGISTLEQSNAYGDFVGQRSSFKVSTWLAPKLVPTPDSIELGGVACAMPCREKMQYRLFLNSGEVVSMCFSQEGPKAMFSDYAIQDVPNATTIRVPFAWSSEVSDSGKEMMHIVWDRGLSEQGFDGTVGSIPNEKQVYRLDYGWGYDGRMMKHFFVLAHTFINNGNVNGVVRSARIHGQGYGVATLDIKSSSIEKDYDMPWQEFKQDISLPPKQKYFYDRMQNVTSIIDHANWGIGTKFKISGSITEGSPVTEPSYVAQVIVMQIDPQGAIDG